MPEIQRQATRMDCRGLDLVHPIDRMPPGSFPQLTNCRVVEEGRIESRPGYSQYENVAAHSMRRLNDPDLSFAANGYTNVVGSGTSLLAGPKGSLVSVDTGYSGNPLSLLSFRPDQSPEAWMYVYDQNKNSKVRPDGAVQPIGIPPPASGPTAAAEYGPPAMVDISTGQAVGAFAGSGTSSITLVDRAGGLAPTIVSIRYNSGTTGWCTIQPNNTAGIYPGGRMMVRLNNGGGNAENVLVREIHAPIIATTIAGVVYDSGTTGLCSMVLTNSPAGLARNSLIQLSSGSEIVRVLAVILSPDGATYSIRCSTTGAHAAAENVTGILSWYCYTVNTHAAAEAIADKCVYATVASISVSATSPTALVSMQLLGNIDASKAGGRPIEIANDYMHLSFWATNAPGIVQMDVFLDVDPQTTTLTPGAGGAFGNNYYQFTLLPAQIFGLGVPTAGAWQELVIPLSQAVRVGDDPTQTLSNIKAIKIQLTLTVKTDFAFDWWYLFGTYGPTIQPNSPVGMSYESRNRNSGTGAASVPGPPLQYQLFPLREQVLVTPQPNALSYVDSLDIYRFGGAVSDFTYIGTVANNNGTPNVYSDNLPDTSIEASPQADTTLIQPWPLLDLPWTGTVNVVGTRVTLASGTNFKTSLLSASVILINGVAYQVYGQPDSTTTLNLFLNAGVQTGATYLIASPTLAGQPLPLVFGPLEGPLSPVAFGLGDPVSGGTLYYSNSADLDSSSDKNTVECASPSEPLIGGATWNGLVVTGSRENLYLVRYSYMQTLGIPGQNTFQYSKLPAPTGMWSRWACCTGPDGVYLLGRDGIYRVTDQGAVSITDSFLYPLFPHDGQTASGGYGYLAVDMNNLAALRLSSADESIYFDYADTSGAKRTLRWEVEAPGRPGRWFAHSYADSVVGHYAVEPSASAPNDQQLYLLGAGIFQAGGNTDNGAALTASFLPPASDGGDERSQKLYPDAMVQADGTGTLSITPYYDNAQVAATAASATCAGSIQQALVNIASLADLTLHRNITALFSWTGGPAGPRVYAWEPAAYLQPYLSTFLVTQFINLSYPGWKVGFRLYPGLISTAVVTFKIKCQDGRTFTYEIPSTDGQFKVVPMILNHGLKDLAFAFELDGHDTPFAMFSEAFTVQFKGWKDPEFLDLAVYRT